MKPYEIKGQCVAKRAFEVAAVGDLAVMLVGPLASSKTTLREAFPTVRSAERETCACGHYQDVRRDCSCSAVSVARWIRRIERDARSFEIVLEACPTTTRDMMSQRPPDTQEDDFRDARILAARKFGETHTSLALNDDAAQRTVEMASRRLALTYGQYNAMLKVARAIANLDASDQLKAKHVAEAVQYSGACMIRCYQRAA